MITAPPPKQIGKSFQVLPLEGSLFPWSEDQQPVLIEITGAGDLYLACFTNAEKLRSFMERSKIRYAKIKQIMNAHEFLSSIPVKIKIILDPWFTIEGKVRYKQLHRDESTRR